MLDYSPEYYKDMAFKIAQENKGLLDKMASGGQYVAD